MNAHATNNTERPDTPTAADLPPMVRDDGAASPVQPLAPGSAVESLERTLSFRLLMLHKLSERYSAMEFAGAVGLTPSDGRALATLGAFEPLSVVALAEACSLNKSQASRAAQGLVDKGLAHKQFNTEDARGVVLTLTPAGRLLYQRTLQLVNDRSREMFGCLDAGEQAIFSDMLDRLIQHNRERGFAGQRQAP